MGIALIILLVSMTSSTVFAQTENFKVFNGVGKEIGDGSKTFDIQYSSPKNIISAIVNQKEKSVTFTLVGQVQGNNTLVLKLPNGLVGAPFVGVWVDNQVITNYQVISEGGINTITIPLDQKSEKISVVGASTIPEFGPIAGLVLVVSIITAIMFARIRLGHKLA